MKCVWAGASSPAARPANPTAVAATVCLRKSRRVFVGVIGNSRGRQRGSWGDSRQTRGVAAVTLKKEVASFRACWNWGVQAGLVKGPFPGRGLRFPKEGEKESVSTFAEIEAVIAAEKPDDARRDALWEALYLTRP